jgi:phospholipid transport system substrate-binding protein
MPPKRLPLLAAIAALLLAPLAAAPARAADPAASQIDSLDSALIDAMKAGSSLTAKARYAKLEPVVERTFDLPAMARFAVGMAWSSFTPTQQQQVVEAFTRLTISSYAHNFNKFDGERFSINPTVLARGPYKVVQTQLIRTHDAPITLAYQMHEAGGGWKIVDIQTNGISQLTTKRSDFAAPIASSGAAGLISHLNSLADKQLR